MAAMDLDKINMDLVESLLEWIVDGDHSNPPGKKKASKTLHNFFLSQIITAFLMIDCFFYVNRGCFGLSARAG